MIQVSPSLALWGRGSRARAQAVGSAGKVHPLQPRAPAHGQAYFAQVAGAHGVVMVNSDQSMPRLPGAYMVVPEEDPVIHIPMVAVRQTAGQALRNIIEREGGAVQAAIVAKRWTSQGTFLTGPCTKVYNTQNDIANKTHYKGVEVLSTDGGRLQLPGGDSVEYLRAD